MEAKTHINWNEISGDHLPESFIRRNINKINWEVRCRNYHMTEEELEKYCEYFNEKAWYNIFNTWFNKPKLSESFIEKHIDIVRQFNFWDYICEWRHISESFLDKYIDEIDCEEISFNRLVSESFIEKHSDKLSWKFISECQELSKEFVIKHMDKIHINKLKKNIFIDFKIDVKYYKETDEEMECCICYNKTKTQTIKCNHDICPRCITHKSIINTMKCPYCRQKLESRIEFV
jgi:hypothetical protein